MKYILEIILLFGPATGYALWNGRNGLKHPNPEQVKNVACIMILCVTGVRFLALYYEWVPFAKNISEVLWWYLKAYLVAITGHGLFFNPLINFVLTRHSGWTLRYRIAQSFDRLNPDAVPDKWFIKFKIGWKLRLIGYATLFLASVLWFCWSSFRSLESYLH